MGYSEIWAPWRLEYVQQDAKTEKEPEETLNFLSGADAGCFICQAAADKPGNDGKRHVVFRGKQILVILNRFPYNNGHLLVTPYRHVPRLDLLTADEHLEMMETLGRLIQLLEKTMHPDGFNAGLNLGEVAGAGLPGHIHWHLVPRWNGDTNFMPVLACVNVIPQSLDALWKMLRESL